ncbi:hypothetical protein ABT063_32310 [Streptomyces sp. NPDC002838]|uniref:hypothetical protein n=1 Tax=Streptomyces sp. NPDC002838 TaxID=3154436 RepID=UPI00331FE9C4
MPRECGSGRGHSRLARPTARSEAPAERVRILGDFVPGRGWPLGAGCQADHRLDLRTREE